MKSLFIRQLLLLTIGLLSFSVHAQLSVTSPVARMVFQRNNANQANVLVAGLAPPTATGVEARFVPLAIGQGELTAWTALPFLSNTKGYRGTVTVTAGWYRLDVRAKNGNTILTQTNVNRVGVGEVFVISGQSNAVGGFEREPGAEEDRVSCVDFRQDALDDQLLPLRFSRVSYGSSIGPSHPPHIYGMLGDMLVRRLNVPVLFLGGGQPGTSSTEWQQSAAGGLDGRGRPYPYRRLATALQHYVQRTGARAILWHQGEGDIGSSNATYFNNIQYIIKKSRQQVGFDGLPWLVSRVSYTQGQTNPNVIAAQNKLIAEVPNVYPGPSTDDLIGSDNRLGDNVHFGGNGLRRFAERWNQALTDSFFNQSTPFTPTDESSLITSGYTLPLIRRPGETILVPSLRSDPREADGQYFVQLLRASDNSLVSESLKGTGNPLTITLPADLPDGQYRLRTLSTKPATTGTLSEPFTVSYYAPISSPQAPTPVNVVGGTPDPALLRLGYRYESVVPAFWFMVEATTAVECRVERIDEGSFSDSGWFTMPPASEAPSYSDFSDYNYLRYYAPITFGVGGVPQGRYRLSMRKKGDTGTGLWVETTLQESRNTLYINTEPVAPLPPVITLMALSPTLPCPGSTVSVSFERTESGVNSGNVYTLSLLDADGNQKILGSRSGSPISATLPASLNYGEEYRLQITASSPTVSSAPFPFTLCTPVADISLALQASNRAPHIGQPVTVTATLANTGPSVAPGLVASCRLPAGVAFIDASSAGVSSLSNVITIQAGTLANGAKSHYVFRIKPTQAGSFVTAAQVITCKVLDPDSQPNSGTGDGQDDTAQFDLRTPDNTPVVYISPNPDQMPLPSVQPGQLASDPSKIDLSLAAIASQLVPRAGQPFSVSLTVNNRGATAATNVTVQTQLPTGWQLTGSTTGLTVSGQTVTGTLGTVASDRSVTLVLSILANADGTLRSQVQTASPADSDSKPGNGYQAGEDDEASLALRIR